MSKNSTSTLAVATSLIALALAGNAQAQSVDSGSNAAVQSQDAEIVVTARKTTERLQDVPISITALSANALEARGLSTVTDLQQVAPNIQFTPGTGGNSGAIAPFIRGVGENDFIITADPAVGTYFDGVYVARTFGASAELLDIERVEVLRGPQGSLFGKNTVGGAINVVTRLPGDTPEFEGDLRYGSYNDFRIRARVAVPLSEGLSLGLSGLGQWADGWQKLPSGDTLGNHDVITGRAVLRYVAGPFEAVAQVDGLRRRQNSAAHSMLEFDQNNFVAGLYSMLLFPNAAAPCCTAPDRIDRTDTTASLNRDYADAVNSSLTLSYDLGGSQLKSISAYRWVHAQFGRDGDASAQFNYAGDFHNERARQFSQELQFTTPIFDSGNLLLGAYYYREKTRDLTRLVFADGLYEAALGTYFELPPFYDFNIDFDNKQTTTNYAVFGNATVPVAPALTLELGGRYTHEEKTFYQAAQRIYADIPLVGPPYTLNNSWDAFTPRVSLSYKVRPNVLTYASWSKGFRSGGFNGRPTSPEEISSYDPEHLDAFEFGVKSQLGNIVTLNLAMFRNNYKDQQLLISTKSAASGLIVVRTENAGKSRIQGIELEGSVRVSPRFRIDGSLGLLDAKYLRYESVINDVKTDVSFRTPKQSPDITASIGASYTLPLGSTMDATFRADASYRSANYIDVENTPELRAPDHAILNLSSTIRLPVDGLSLRLAVDNVTNKRVIVAGYDARTSFGFLEGYFNEPRKYWVTLAFRR